MARNANESTYNRLRVLLESGTCTGLTDGQLLRRFSSRRDAGAELAFAALVERHGPMVLGVCRSLLRDDHEAMDVFQATFLVLARKGGSLWVKDSVGPWLHRVATRTAARVGRARRSRRTFEFDPATPAEHREDPSELVAVVQEEIDRLPERFRAAIILCDLEGRTIEEAARRLGCPPGTVGSRVARGRERLRDRLRRRGLAPEGVTVLFGSGLASESVSPELASAAASAAFRFVSAGVVSVGPAVSLAWEVLGHMAFQQWGKVASVVLITCLGTMAAVIPAGATPAPDDPAAPTLAKRFVVKPQALEIVVRERGSLEPGRNTVVANPTRTSARIVSILPEGSRIKKGDLICELEAPESLIEEVAASRARLAESDFALARTKVETELTEAALAEYVDVIAPLEKEAARAEIQLNQEALSRVKARLERARVARDQIKAIRMIPDRIKSPADVVAALGVEDRVEEAELELARLTRASASAARKFELLTGPTHSRAMLRLKAEVEKTRMAAAALAGERQHRAESAKRLEANLASYKIKAPADGLLIYSGVLQPGPDGLKPTLATGSTVREGVEMFSLVDLEGPMLVRARVRESMVDRLKVGQSSRVTIDAFPGQAWEGVVKTIAGQPEPTPFNMLGSPPPKVYPCLIEIVKPGPRLRPGMTASVEVMIETRTGVLGIPIQATSPLLDGRYHVAVVKPGGIELRPVTLGAANERIVEIKSGLAEGETILERLPTLPSDDQTTVTPAVGASNSGAPLPSVPKKRIRKSSPPNREKPACRPGSGRSAGRRGPLPADFPDSRRSPAEERND